jgi:hypothetical protein
MGANRWRDLIKPGLKAIFDYAQQKGLTVMVHSDGDLTEIIPDLIQLGVQILNPIQPECMDILWLKKELATIFVLMRNQQSIFYPLGYAGQIQKEYMVALNIWGRTEGIIGPTKS